MRVDTLWTNARLLTMAQGSRQTLEPGVIAASAGRIVHVGPIEDGERIQPDEIFECGGRLITPGLIDCHTHIVYSGNRAVEFEQRLNGASYEEIARAGGGIVSTMRATRKASQEQLIEEAMSRVDALISEGVTTLEIKSGYGLA
jgi:imidazolonepropionase